MHITVPILNCWVKRQVHTGVLQDCLYRHRKQMCLLLLMKSSRKLLAVLKSCSWMLSTSRFILWYLSKLLSSYRPCPGPLPFNNQQTWQCEISCIQSCLMGVVTAIWGVCFWACARWLKMASYSKHSNRMHWKTSIGALTKQSYHRHARY